MKIIAKAGCDEIAAVYIAETEEGKRIEFVESIQPPNPRDKKWVLIVSNMFGCPVGCRFCDAGGNYHGKLSADEIFSQIDYLIKSRFPDGVVPVEKFKIQFARMGEPALNPAVLDVLNELPSRYDAPGLIPSISTVAPAGCDDFFRKLIKIKDLHYPKNFQFQFSIHTTDLKLKKWLIPMKTWSFEEMAKYGEEFFSENQRKITLNFALAENMPLDPEVLLNYFSPDTFLIKITPINPTFKAAKNNISSLVSADKYIADDEYQLPVTDSLINAGYDVIVSVGETEENQIGSNCGQYLEAVQKNRIPVGNCYTYDIKEI
ncbi:radical SAM protein [Methanogenium sp. MK-MG]|uniref:radical SAM protein n=1 Tax=Methanogenium sp. MK-MG TaxID=2599926 RepID=UPI0013E9E392|nr:radical SAM protein [Methanogenium sp. MK-MG]KAF1077966.1 Dual-specificity RNA methyltransferase RlmN [Methanogenium sp. MK-MG]